MNHLKNISNLFTRDFVENPLLETFEAGKIVLPTGKLIACDPLITNDMPVFTTDFPMGEFQVLVHKERESSCIAYTEIVFSRELVADWQLAVHDGENVNDLAEGEIFGYPVESGMGCYMDAATQDSLNRLEQKLFHRKGADFMGIYEEFFHEHFFDDNGAIDQYAFLKPDEEQGGNLFAFETGYGEGFYASYVGFSADRKPVKLVTEFIEIEH